ncbi:LOW QUALITY PROTEIN: condensin complex subunit 2-like [Hylaeus volcanicus]|uniref:LOW QUALITY PROTEIN: condensin complex subunit 2-like n=1 Tax=Hylaeus volcanicus TaxID=313075 RepID=UPI0023B85DAC|nr:LOW QUALITY PROTEIN: condensin complex subunit 2-like [Hylaeus volcanicus]
MDTTVSSSPLRRKSVLPQKSVDSSVLVENDDEAERLARRRENVTTSTLPSSGRLSLGLSSLNNISTPQMRERISQCIKLGAENKINPQNAFSLEMIDFMTYMVKKQDANMSNLQVASTSLDVSTKIYGFRVDGIHSEILKMMTGLEKEVQSIIEPMDVQENGTGQLEVPVKNKKKKTKQICITVKALGTTVEIKKPSLLSISGDLESTDMLDQVTLPNHANSGFYLHPYNDVLVDTVNCKDIQCKDVSIPRIEDISNMQICPFIHHFNFLSWNADDIEAEKTMEEETNQNRFHFDLNASVSYDNQLSDTSRNPYDLEVNEEEIVNRFVGTSNQVQNIVDFREVVTTSASTKVSEYSYIKKNVHIHWTGPTHWKCTNLNKMLSNDNIIGTCRQTQARKRKDIILMYDDETLKNLNDKFVPSQSLKISVRTAKQNWNEEELTLPLDAHYDIKQASILYLLEMFRYSKYEDEMNRKSVSDIDNDNYDNENNIDYLSESNNNEVHEADEPNLINNDIGSTDESMLRTQGPLTGNNLVVAPKQTNKLLIAHCSRQKKIDMRELKKSMWKCLTTGGIANTEDVEQDAYNKVKGKKDFSQIYKELPNLLSKTNREALSFPVSFISLLHLANEKLLQLTTPSDMSDVIIEQD